MVLTHVVGKKQSIDVSISPHNSFLAHCLSRKFTKLSLALEQAVIIDQDNLFSCNRRCNYCLLRNILCNNVFLSFLESARKKL